MKIIFITREGYRLPGARIRCYNFSKELSKYGLASEVLSFSDNLGAKDGEEEASMGKMERILLNYKAFKILAKDKQNIFYIQRFNYHSFAPFLVHLLNGNRMILDLDDWEMRENPKYHLGFFPSSRAHYITRDIAKRSVCCIAASRFLENILSDFNRRVYYVPSGVDTELFNQKINKTPNDKVIFSWIGTFHKKEYIENIAFALDCFIALREKYKHIYLEITGDGIYKDDLKQILNKYNDTNVYLKDWIGPDDIPAYLSGVHVGLFPVVRNSKFNLAKSPTKLFEYMAMAKPTVSSGIGEARNIINDNKNGFLAQTKEEFIEKMKMLIDNSSLRQEMGYNARETVEKYYSLTLLGRQLYEIFSKL